jgi:hypothetical protein
MKFWISRDKDSSFCILWSRKPKQDSIGGYYSSITSHVRSFCIEDFERFTDIRLKDGECKEFNGVFTIKRKRGGK